MLTNDRLALPPTSESLAAYNGALARSAVASAPAIESTQLIARPDDSVRPASTVHQYLAPSVTGKAAALPPDSELLSDPGMLYGSDGICLHFA